MLPDRALFQQSGFYLLPGYYDTAYTEVLIAALAQAATFDYSQEFADSNLLHTVPMLAELARGPLAALIRPLFDSPARPLQAILLDKTPGSNWQLDWHQDLKIAVKSRCRHPVSAIGPPRQAFHMWYLR